MEPIYEKWLQNPGPERGYAVYSFAVLGRNLRDIPFAFHADAPQREEIRERIEEIMQKGKDRSYLTKDKLQLLRRNPGATSGKYKLAFAEFRNETWPEFKAEVKEKIKEKLEEREEK